jgi:asparaginyl-tRNA synthetase
MIDTEETTPVYSQDLLTRHLRVGSDPNWVKQRIAKAAALAAMRGYLDSVAFTEVEPPPAMTTLTGACENLETLWGPYDYYGDSYFMAQTSQPLLELLISPEVPRVYTISQSYRKETSQFGRRLACFNMLEVEVMDGTLETLRQVLQELVRGAQKCVGTLEMMGGYDVITYSEAITMLQSHNFTINYGEDLQAQHELALAKTGPVFITEYPRHLKFFNAALIDGSNNLTQSMDLLLPGVGEAAGCTVREHRPHILARQLHDYAYDPKRAEDVKRLGLTGPEALIDAYGWYVTKPSIQHAGFGVGISRLWQYLFGESDVKDVVEFPRVAGLLLP